MSAVSHIHDEDGYLTVQFVFVAGLTLLLFAMIANLIVVQYGRGVVRAAADEGARFGSVLDADATACEARARAVVGSLLPGPFGRDIAVSCRRDDAGQMTAAVNYRFDSWLPGLPDYEGVEGATAVKEVIP